MAEYENQEVNSEIRLSMLALLGEAPPSLAAVDNP
jgi:hypothetical protein